MLGGKELERLNLHKQMLVLESGLNRLKLQAEVRHLRCAVAEIRGASRKRAPLLLVLAPLAGFLLARGVRRSGSWLNRLAAAAKWIGPAYTLWRSLAAARKRDPEADRDTL